MGTNDAPTHGQEDDLGSAFPKGFEMYPNLRGEADVQMCRRTCLRYCYRLLFICKIADVSKYVCKQDGSHEALSTSCLQIDLADDDILLTNSRRSPQLNHECVAG
jgi:hypothetical protein